MQALKTFLWFDGKAEEAVDFWVSVFRDAKKGPVHKYADSFPDPKWRGKVITASFRLRGQEFVALNAGADFQFTPAVSFMVLCVTDQYGVTWQITPETLDAMINDPDKAKAERAMHAMMGMVKLDIAALERAWAGD
jgi:predicted 3-demethylubiquinone-9 3-methyltransferase (glyoxalase superfamily)